MTRRSWLAWSTTGVVAALVCAVIYYRAGGETTWVFVVMTVFTAVWIPLQVWIGRRSTQVAARVRAERRR